MIPLPTHPPAKRKHIARTFGRGEVLRLCKEAGYGRDAAQMLFFNVGCAARILLPPCKYARYSREVVLSVLGLDQSNL